MKNSAEIKDFVYNVSLSLSKMDTKTSFQSTVTSIMSAYSVDFMMRCEVRAEFSC